MSNLLERSPVRRNDAYFLSLIQAQGYTGFEIFEKDLKKSSDPEIISKLAVRLIDDGYPRPFQLYSSLPECPARQKLLFRFLEQGIIPVHSPQALEGSKYLATELEKRPDLKEMFLSGMTLEVVGQIMTVELFSGVSDEKKLEELRSWTTGGMLRSCLGLLTGERPKNPDLSVHSMLDRIPEKVFSNKYMVRYNLVEHFFEQQLMSTITDLGLEEGIAAIENQLASEKDEAKRYFLEQILNRFYDIATQPLKGDFKDEILVRGKKKKFPSFEQRSFVYDFLNYGCRFLTAEVGMGKTGAAFLAMENSDARRVLVLVQASGKGAWTEQDKVLFKNPGNVFVLDHSADLDDPNLLERIGNKKYIVVSQELLGFTEQNPELLDKFNRVLMQQLQVDSVVIDEIDNMTNYKAVSTQTSIHLVEKARQNYFERTGRQNAPVIGLTATPLRTGLSDLNVPMAILYPEEYALSVSEVTDKRKLFSDTCLNHPELAYSKLVGERRMFRWETATGVQELTWDTVKIKASPFEKYIYDFIEHSIGGNAFTKIRLLEDFLLNPLLVKAEVRERAGHLIPEIDTDEVYMSLIKVLNEWKLMWEVEEPVCGEDYLSVDRLVQMGFGQEVLGCFFSILLENGMDTLVEEYTRSIADPDAVELRKFWKPRPLSSKYEALERLIRESLIWTPDEEGVQTRSKVLIVSPARKQGRTGDIAQRMIEEEDGQERPLYAEYERDYINDSALYKLLRKWCTWICDEENILVIDGTQSVGKARDRLIARWVNEPESAVLLGTLEAMYQSRDYTLENIIDECGRKISGVRKIFLGWTWYWQQFRQMTGRDMRQGQKVPSENLVLEVEDLIDPGKGERVYYTYLLTRMLLSGLQLSTEDQEFLDSKKTGSKIPLQSAEIRFLRDVLNTVRCRGEDFLTEFLSSVYSGEEKTLARKLAEKYFNEGKDECQISGYNAEMVAYLMSALGLAEKEILSLGAGTLLLQRKLKRGITNVDINPEMMEAGWTLASEFGGKKICARGSSLNETEFPSGSFDFADCAFALHWSKPGDSKTPAKYSERARILSQIHRVLKDGGVLALTLPEGSLDEERFSRFINALKENFGFEIDEKYSGRSFAISKNGLRKRIGWCIVARKTGALNLEYLKPEDLSFLYEKTSWVSEGQKQSNGVKNNGTDHHGQLEIKLEIDKYEIVDLQNRCSAVDKGDIRQLSGNVIEAISAIIKEEEMLKLVKGETEADFHYCRNALIRPLQSLIQESGISFPYRDWNEVTRLGVELLTEACKRSGKKPKDQKEAFPLILKEFQLYRKRELTGGKN